MAMDEGLLLRLREIFETVPDFAEKRMFGGICFMVSGHMTCGVGKHDGLMLRVGPERYEKLLGEDHAREMDFTGRPMKGFLFIDNDGIAEDEDLRVWIERALAFTRSLPQK